MSEPMEIRTYRVRFTTPAFLGGADQSGQWRTPPFKHLLREWWRVAYAERHRYRVRVSAMHREEGALFGAAADGEGTQSLVRMRLGRWKDGRMKAWQAGPKVFHPEVGKAGTSVGSDLYLGYGPLGYDKGTRSTSLQRKCAIDAGEEAELRLAFPRGAAAEMDRVMGLVARFGALGGRSRNGWGSLALEPAGGAPLDGAALPLRPWRECLDREWAHAVGLGDDGRPLVWETDTFDDWRRLMRQLAEVKIGLRTQFRFTRGHGDWPEPRHWLAYPVTNHRVKRWGNRRLPNTLRFKVRADKGGRLRGVIFHMPCRPPWASERDVAGIEEVWRRVHAFLDGRRELQRLAEGG